MKKLFLIALLFSSGFKPLHAQTQSSVKKQSGSFARNTMVERIAINNFPFSDSAVTNGKYERYMQRSVNQKTAGFCLLGAGTIVLVIGLASFPRDADILFTSDENHAKADRATNATIAGSAVMLGSIPFFILSSASKHRARISVTSQKTGIKLSPNLPTHVASVSLSFPIGK